MGETKVGRLSGLYEDRQQMEHYLASPECRGGQLVVVGYWTAGEVAYSAYIRCVGAMYCFEGKGRVGRGRHIYFPKEMWSNIAVGNKNECIKFIENLLPACRCPRKELDEMITTITEWQE